MEDPDPDNSTKVRVWPTTRQTLAVEIKPLAVGIFLIYTIQL